MEGTMVGSRSDEVAPTEIELEEKFVQLMTATPGMVMVTTSSQNIDRLVTLYKAASRCQRFFIIDFYTAEILEKLAKYAKLPQPSWSNIRVCYPKRPSKRFELIGLQDILEKHRRNGIRWQRLREIKDKVVLLVRPNFLQDIEKYLSLEGATWIYSMWPGYFDRDLNLKDMQKYFHDKYVRCELLHTGGHAGLSDLKRLAEALKPTSIVPIHSFYSYKFTGDFSNLVLLKDGEMLSIV